MMLDMSRILPVPKAVKDLLEDLLGRPVTVSPADPLRSADLADSFVATYVDQSLQLGAVVALEFALTAYVGAAIGLIPRGGAQACIEDREISKMIGENTAEVCNVLTTLLNQDGAVRLSMYETFLPGQPPTLEASGSLQALGRRLDLTVEVGGYGTGKLSVALAGPF